MLRLKTRIRSYYGAKELKINAQRYMQRAFIVSALIHIVLIGWLSSFLSLPDKELPVMMINQLGSDFSIIEIKGTGEEKQGGGNPAPPPKPISPPVLKQSNLNNRTRMITKLPQLRIPEPKKAKIESAPKERVYLEQSPSRLETQAYAIGGEPQREEITPDLRERYIGKREETQGQITATGDWNSLYQQSSLYGGGGLGSSKSYSIEWTGTGVNRTKIRGDPPQYPSGMSKSAIIRIRFSVLPNGSVGQMTLIQKGDPTFEAISVRALRTWQFNRLEADAPQISQQGIVTFIFRVE